MKNLRILTISSILLLLLNLVFLPAVAQEISQFRVKNFSRQDYNAENQNWSVTEDKRGFIYAANNIGLLEFDGTDWGFFPAPKNTILRSVAVDSLNRIFTSGYRELGFWEHDSLGNLNYFSLNELAEPFFNSNEEFWTTVIQGDRIYFHSFSSIFIYENSSFKIIRPPGTINSIGKLGNDIWVHISEKGICYVKDTTVVPFITDPVIRDDLVRFIYPTGQDEYIIGTASDGMYLYSKGKLSPVLGKWKSYFIKNQINRGDISKEGNLIIGTILDGISVFNREGELLYHINNENGLQNNTVLGIFNDRNDNTWLALDRGIDFISQKSDPSYTVFNTEEVGAVYAAAVFEGDLFLATNQGVFYRRWEEDKGNFVFLEGTQGQAWNCSVIDNNLLIGHNNGTFAVEDRKSEKISLVGGGFSLTRNMKEANSLIQCTYSNIVFYSKKGKNWKYDHPIKNFNNLMRYIEMDHLGNLWASHMHRGVYFLRMNDREDSIVEERYYGTETFGKDNDIQVFKVENRIVFTNGLTLYTYDDINDTIIPYVQLSESLGNFAASHRIIPGPDHHYWFVSTKGIALFEINNNIVQKIKEYPAELFKDHLIIGYENILPLESHVGLLCMDNGYAILDCDKGDLSRMISDKKMILKSIEISQADGKTEKLKLSQDELVIPYKKNSLSLKYSFPLYSTEQLWFQFYIEGIDTGWSNSFSKPEFSFKRLPPGEYTIRVKAKNNWLVSSMTDQLKIVVSPPWYLSWISFILYLVFISGIIIFSRRIMISRFKLREQKIREAKERELIRLRNEKLNSELSFKSQELANSTMAVIKKNEFLLELKNIVKAQKEELGLRYPEKYYQKIVRKIDNNISSMDDWKIFETHFERAHEKFLHKLMNNYPSLTPGDLRLCAYLRMNLSSKEIAPLLKISVRGVENHRYKLRKKLNLKPDENLLDFILSV